MSLAAKLQLQQNPRKSRRSNLSMTASRFSRKNSFVEIADEADDRTIDTNLSEKIVLPLREISEELSRSELVSLHFSQEDKVWVTGKKSAEEVIQENTGEYGSICFVVRRPGCGLCRENGMLLSAMTMLPGKPLDGFGLFGVIKETGVDDAGLSDFHSYFPYPMYRDDDKAFYKAFGFRKLRLNIKSPISTTSKALRIMSRLKQKKIKTNFRGEGLIQGGIIFFGPDLKPMYLYEEVTGDEVSVQDVLDVVDTIRTQHL